jgi:hypothetical protein
MWDYIVDNLIFFIIVILCVAAIISILVILSVSAKKAREEAQNELKEKEEAALIEETEQSAQKNGSPSNNKDKTDLKTEGGSNMKNEKDKATPEKASDKTPKKTYNGKWVLTRVNTVSGDEVKESTFFFRLLASNGESLLAGEDYTSLRGALAGIDTFKGNIAAGNFKISHTEKGKYIVKLLSAQGSLLAQGEKYDSSTAAKNAIASIKRFAATAVREEKIQALSFPYQEVTAPVEEKNYDFTKKGKWVIHALYDEKAKETSYYFDLKASNGKVLFTSEDYTTLNGLKSGIDTHKANIADGNIRACLTRSGDYIMKIFTADFRLLSLGGHYDQKQVCLNAIDSVIRFAATAEIDDSEIKNAR